MAFSLKAARVNAGLTQQETVAALAKKGYKTAVSTLVSWEQYKTFPTTLVFKELCNIYGCKMDDVFVPETLT